MAWGDLDDRQQAVGTDTDDTRLLAVLRGLADAVLLVDGEGRLTWANAAAERLFGLAARGLGRSLGPGADPPRRSRSGPRVAGVACKARRSGRRSSSGCERLAAGGWSSWSGPRCTDEPDGTIVLSVRDLTERRRWEVAGDQVARFRSLMHNAATVTMLVSAEGEVEAVSGALTRLLGQDPEAVQGRRWPSSSIPRTVRCWPPRSPGPVLERRRSTSPRAPSRCGSATSETTGPRRSS